jgi:DNA polymerase-1
MKFKKPRLLIIDGRNLLWRTADAFQDLFIVSDDGKQIVTGGIYGFLSILIKIHQRHSGQTIIVWEGRKNFRFALYPDYKKRKKIEGLEEKIKEINEQQSRLKAILIRIGVEQYEGVDCEADDVMATLAKRWTKSGENEAVIYTADSDLRQCVDHYITVISPYRKGEDIIFNSQKVFERHGVYPKYISDLKALAGDSSDNIPGLMGIGEKKAAKLINSFGNINEIIENATNEKIEDKKIEKLILENISNLVLYKKLTSVNIKAKYKKIEADKSQKHAIKHLHYYKIHSLTGPVELRELMTMGNSNE